MHNGTLWSWNRPLVGFEADGTPHVRIEHRVMSAGPTAVDMFANLAFALGLAKHFSCTGAAASTSPAAPLEQQIPFATARKNFYAAARSGLAAEVEWLGRRHRLQTLVLEQWLPAACQGLEAMNVDASLITAAEAILRERIASNRTGAVWQLEAFDRHAGDTFAILDDYLNCQATKKPVHEW
jgi:gamma-glutamyl:cysteine ligase YbdK (ATP-grasp superfamily)